VFDFCEHDLAGLLLNVNVMFTLGEVKRVMQQLLNGLYYIHSNKVNPTSTRICICTCINVLYRIILNEFVVAYFRYFIGI